MLVVLWTNRSHFLHTLILHLIRILISYSYHKMILDSLHALFFVPLCEQDTLKD